MNRTSFVQELRSTIDTDEWDLIKLKLSQGINSQMPPYDHFQDLVCFSSIIHLVTVEKKEVSVPVNNMNLPRGITMAFKVNDKMA